MNPERLLKLADLLEADADNQEGIRFDLMWIGRKFDPVDGTVVGFHGGEIPQLNCGTVACAVGLACLSKTFQGEGLGFEVGWDGEMTPTFGEYFGWGSAETAFFGLTDEQSDFLFSPFAYKKGEPTKEADGERYVAQRIRKFVAGEVGPIVDEQD